MNISLEEIISMVVKEVIAELSKKGIHIENEISHAFGGIKAEDIIKMDFKEYKTPLLTEAHILEVDLNIKEIEVPKKTIITPSAQDLIRKRKIIITKK